MDTYVCVHCVSMSGICCFHVSVCVHEVEKYALHISKLCFSTLFIFPLSSVLFEPPCLTSIEPFVSLCFLQGLIPLEGWTSIFAFSPIVLLYPIKVSKRGRVAEGAKDVYFVYFTLYFI